MLHSSTIPVSLLLASIATAVSFNCVPGDSCWPSQQQWAAFNSSVDGRLQVTEPLASSCYDSSGNYDPAQCREVEEKYGDDVARASIYGATENIQWEGCGPAKCLVKTFHPQAPPIDGTCSLGSLSAYYVNATNAEDVSKTLDFVNKHNVRLSIKNSGHDYLGRSVAANSLALWTRNIRNLEYHKKFTPNGCSASYSNIGVIGAGVSAGEARAFFANNGMDITLGAIGSVGPAGGFGQGGGHGPLGPTHGLMVDQAVEFDVVTADGQFRTINACQDPDLFWAMRGGGGGTYAVMINYKFKVFPSVTFNTYSFFATIERPEKDMTQDAFYETFLTAFVEHQEQWSNNNISGYNFFSPKSIETHLIYPSNKPLSYLMDITSQWANFLTSLPGVRVTRHSYEQYPNYSAWADDDDYRGIITRNAPGGLAVVETGRLIPRSLFSPENTPILVEAMLKGMTAAAAAGGTMQVYATTPANTPDADRQTSAHPAWRDALWSLDFVAGYVMGTAEETIAGQWNATRMAIQYMKDLTPGGGCYVNEADYGEEEWEQTFFGENYERLAEIKDKYDPKGLFNCWKCVGWTGKDDERYSCYGKDPHPTEPLQPISESRTEFQWQEDEL